MRIFVTILVVAVILCDCKKENISLPQGQTFRKSGKEEPSIRVFSANGEIKNAETINRFTQLDDVQISWLSNFLGTLDTIQIIDDKNARLFENGKFSDFNYTRVSNDFNFYSKDTITGSSLGEVYSRTLAYAMCLYKPVIYSEYIFSSTGGNYLFQYRSRREHIINRSGDHLAVPWIVYDYHSVTGSSIYTIQNRLDLSFYKSLHPHDTIVLKEYSINYE